MKTWLKAILGGVAGAFMGALVGVVGMLVWFFWLSPPTFKNDSEAMGFAVILIAFGALTGGGGAVVGAITGSAMIWWRASRHKVAGALFSMGGSLSAWFFDQLWVSVLLFLLTVAVIIWDSKTKAAVQDQLR